MLPDGGRKERWLEHWSQPIQSGHYAGGRAELYYDITERRHAEEALKASEEKYRTVLEANPDPVVVYDPEGKVIYFNPAFTRVFGWSLQERIGKKMDDFVPEENWPETKMMIDKVTVSGESFSGLETRRYTKNGEILPISISGSFYRDQEGNITASVINLRDTSEQKKLEAQLQKAQKMEAIATLAGGIAHEFNNALTTIVGNIQLLEMNLSDHEAVKKHVEPMKASSHLMASLTSQLLAYAQGGKYQAKFLSLSDFIEDTLPIIKPNVDPSIRIDTDLPKDIFSVKADPTQMQMVLSAVVNNSAEAIEGEGRIRITTSNEEIDEDFVKSHPELNSGRYVCLSVEDDGKGMDEEMASKIFEPFFTTKFIGRGLGMAAVYGIIRNHDGWITVDSEQDKGTVVHIYLPAIELEEEVKKEAIVESKPEIAKGEGTILIIEDDEMVLNVTRAIRELLGYRILEARTGNEAVEIAKTFDGDIDLVLLDIKLPDIPGAKVYPLIMKVRPNLKVIVCSGYSIDSPARAILDAGAQDFIQKPFRIETLSKKLRKALGG